MLIEHFKLLICALGLTSPPFDDFSQSSNSNERSRQIKPLRSVEARDSRVFEQAEIYFSAAQMRLGALLGQPGVLETQCFFFAGMQSKRSPQDSVAVSSPNTHNSNRPIMLSNY